MPIEILVVDDVRRAAEEYARLIQLKTELSTFTTDDPLEAVKLAKTNPIRVAVLDQRMPRRSGTNLYRDLKQIDPSIKAIMLTGEADASEVGEALKIGFASYLHKSDLGNLPNEVLLYHAQYEVDLAKKATDYPTVQLYQVRRGVPFGHEIEVNLIASEILENQWVFHNSWVTTKQLNSGEQIREVDHIEITRRFIIEHEEDAKVASTVTGDVTLLANLKTSLESVLSDRYKEHLFSERKHTFEVVREYKLPEEPVSPQELHVVSRHFQRAPVYRGIRCLLMRFCQCCGTRKPFVVVVYQLTSKIATQQIDYLSDGSSRTVPTGIEVY